ncbi:PREDICTED: protein FAM8A1 [Elephantulus edwardii]|uniref:protein FAM8A1 n=1 Tax=Elephantulus edwardii TaxID=28737 RepID=UPI0003F0E067|nr:PREDICTED: protein FAM8A1 [Elephantulus edwardii]
MAEGPEEVRGRPPGQDDGRGDHEPGPSLKSPPSVDAAAPPHPRAGPQTEPQAPGKPPTPELAPAASAVEESGAPRELGEREEADSGSDAGLEEPAGRDAPGAATPLEKPARLSAREYSRQVHEWLWQSYCGYLTWHNGLAAFPAYCCPQVPAPTLPAAGAAPQAAAPAPQLAYYNPFYFLSAATAGPESGTAAGVAAPAPVSGLGPRAPQAQGSGRSAPGTRAGPAAASRTPSEPGRQAGREYVIPSLAHRFMAEMVDFFILFFIKATIVLSIMHLSGIKDISKFAMHYIIEEIDEDTSMEDLQKMMVVALIYRLLVCFYEIICIWGAGGATPGKFLLGLRVVTCDTSVLIAPSRVLVIPSSNVSITTSTVRALIKNFSIASFFPAFITLLFFQHNRTAYDIVAGTIVVKRNGVR